MALSWQRIITIVHLSHRLSVLKCLSQSDVKTCCLIAKNTWQRALSSIKFHHIPFSDHKTNQQCTSLTHKESLCDFYFDKSKARRSIGSTSMDSTILTSQGDLTWAIYRRARYTIYERQLLQGLRSPAYACNVNYTPASRCVYFFFAKCDIFVLVGSHPTTICSF